MSCDVKIQLKNNVGVGDSIITIANRRHEVSNILSAMGYNSFFNSSMGELSQSFEIYVETDKDVRKLENIIETIKCLDVSMEVLYFNGKKFRKEVYGAVE
jgi:hypothetical protein